MNWDEARADSRYELERTRAFLWVPARGVVVTKCVGVGDLGAVRLYTARVDRVLMGGNGCRVFHHWLGVTSFDPAARTHLRQWATERAKLLADAHYLVASKILAMAIAAAALALRRSLLAYNDERVFEGALEGAITAADVVQTSSR